MAKQFSSIEYILFFKESLGDKDHKREIQLLLAFAITPRTAPSYNKMAGAL